MKFNDLNLLDIGNTIQITGVIYSGQGTMLLCMFPDHQGTMVNQAEFADCCVGDVVFTDENSDFGIEVLNMSRDEWTQFLRQTDIMETEVLAEAEENGVRKVVKAILRKSSRQISQAVSWAVFRRDGYACRYCGNDEVPLTVDHLVLWEDGGPSIEDNLVAADKRCNKTRGNLPYSQWLQHPYYKKVSQNLTPTQREANQALVKTLDTIPRMAHKHSHR